MESLKEKQFKEQQNETLHTSRTTESVSSDKKELPKFSEFVSETALGKNLDNKSFQRMKDIFEKTEAMNAVAKEKNQQLEQQFTFLKQKLGSSSECLLRIKKNIENLKFSYQKNFLELHKNLDTGEILDPERNPFKTKYDMTRHMEEIRRKIEGLQTKVTVQREKQQQVTESYQEAFERVANTLQEIDKGSYSSQNLQVE